MIFLPKISNEEVAKLAILNDYYLDFIVSFDDFEGAVLIGTHFESSLNHLIGLI